jgi:hypothetical protein
LSVQVGFALRAAIVFVGVTLFSAVTLTSSNSSFASRITVGAAIASSVFVGLSFLLVSKGHGLGKMIVSKPSFVTPVSLALHKRDIELVGGPKGEVPITGHTTPSDIDTPTPQDRAKVA